MRVPYGTRVEALRTAQPRANKVEVVNAVIEDFEPGCGSKKGPEMPWSISACLDLSCYRTQARNPLSQHSLLRPYSLVAGQSSRRLRAYRKEPAYRKTRGHKDHRHTRLRQL